jgi:hypothetical protein
MRPRPTRPRVLPRSSTPASFFFSQTPRFIAASAAGIRGRATASARGSSATLMLLAPGAFMTMMPRPVAAGVDVVDAGPGAGDHPKPRRGGDQSGRRPRGAAHDERVGRGKITGQLARRIATAARVDGPSWNSRAGNRARMAGRESAMTMCIEVGMLQFISRRAAPGGPRRTRVSIMLRSAARPDAHHDGAKRSNVRNARGFAGRSAAISTAFSTESVQIAFTPTVT